MDWIIQALDHASRKKLRCGNSFAITAELTGPFNTSEFQKKFLDYCAGFPQLRARVRRGWNLAPYWQFLPPEKMPARWVQEDEAPGIAEALRMVEASLNADLEQESLPIKVLAVRVPDRLLLGFIFDHRFFDARGGEIFLQEFQNYFLSGGSSKNGEFSPAPASLDHWAEKFEAGRKVNRARIARESGMEIQSLKEKGSEPARNRFEIRSFTREETAEIEKRCAEKSGPFMFLQYSLVFAVQAMRALFNRKKVKGDLIIPVTRDLRPDSSPEKMFFNHFSFLFFRVPAGRPADFENLLKTLQVQFYEQVKNRMAEALWEASMLIRIVPRPFLSDPKASFSFAALGESAYRDEFLMRARIENMIHLPRVPARPGAGFFFSRYRGRLNLVFSYIDSLVTEEEAREALRLAGAL